MKPAFTANGIKAKQLKDRQIMSRPALPRTFAGLLALSAGVLLILVLLLFTILTAADLGFLNRPIEWWVSHKLHRSVRFGHFSAHLLSSHPRFEVRQIVIANVDWAGRRPLAQIERINVSTRLMPLFIGRLDAREVSISGVSLNLARLRDGRNNWTFGGRPSSDVEFEPLRHTRVLDIRGGEIDFVDLQRSAHFRGRFKQAPSGAMPFSLTGTTMLSGVPVQLVSRGGPLNGAGVGTPYPFTATVKDGATTIRARGTSRQPFDFKHFDIGFDARGPNLADIGYLFNLRLPNSAPFTLQTDAHGDGPRFLFAHLHGKLGQSDLSGWVRSDHSSPVPKGIAALSANVLTKGDVDAALSPVAPRRSARARSGAAAIQPSGRWILSDAPLPIQNLGKVDVAASIHVEALRGYSLQLRHIATHVRISRGKLTYDSLSAKLYGGHVSGKIALDTKPKRPAVTLNVVVRGVQLAEVSQAAGSRMSGTLDAFIILRGTGASLHQAAATAFGKASIGVHRGSVPPAAGYMLGGDMLRAIGSLGDSRKQMTLNCASVHLSGSSGRLAAPSLVISTPAGATGGSGSIDLGNEQLRFSLFGAPAQRRLFHVAMPILLQGSIRHPSVTVLPGRNARRLGLKGKLGAALSPLAAIIPMGPEPAPAIAVCR